MKANELVQGIPVVLAGRNRGLKYVEGSQKTTLWATNREENDRLLLSILDRISKQHGREMMEQILERTTVRVYSRHACHQIDERTARMKQAFAEKSEISRKYRETEEQLLAEKQINAQLLAEKQISGQLRTELERIRHSREYRTGYALMRPLHIICSLFHRTPEQDRRKY